MKTQEKGLPRTEFGGAEMEDFSQHDEEDVESWFPVFHLVD